MPFITRQQIEAEELDIAARLEKVKRMKAEFEAQQSCVRRALPEYIDPAYGTLVGMPLDRHGKPYCLLYVHRIVNMNIAQGEVKGYARGSLDGYDGENLPTVDEARLFFLNRRGAFEHNENVPQWVWARKITGATVRPVVNLWNGDVAVEASTRVTGVGLILVHRQYLPGVEQKVPE